MVLLSGFSDVFIVTESLTAATVVVSIVLCPV